MSNSSVPVKAGGDINPARFVTLSNAANHTVVEANSADTKVIGVSAEFTKSVDSTLHSSDGLSPTIFRRGTDPMLTIGSGGCTAGDFLKPDNDGKGVTAGSGDVAHAQAYESASENEKAKVEVISPFRLP